MTFAEAPTRPAAEPIRRRTRTRFSAKERQGIKMYRLLIVDETMEQCEATKALLRWGVYGISSVITATSYVEAVDKAMDLNPHVVLVNVRLGNHQGWELVEHLRSIGLKAAYCMLSDDNAPDLIRESMRSGAQDFLLRPLQSREMRAFLERNLACCPKNKSGSASEDDEVDPVLGVAYSSLSKITNKIILVVRSNYRSPQTLISIAENLNMSSKYIGRVFLKDTGIKFSEYLMAYRMLEAKRLIVSSQEKISAIAGMVGYVQLNNFYIHFKNYFGVSPSALRNFNFPQASAELPSGETHERPI